MPDDSPAALPLNYQKRPALHRRKRFRRWVLVIIPVCLAAAVWRWREPLWNDAQFLYWQHRCLTYTAPKDQIVGMSDTDVAMTTLAKNDSAYTIDSVFDEPSFVRRIPPTWDRYFGFISGPVSANLFVGSSTPLTAASANTTGRTPPPPPPGPTIAFMHERRSPDGQRRLVVVSLSQEQGKIQSWCLSPCVYPILKLPSLYSETYGADLEIAGSYRARPEEDTWTAVQSAKFYAGQVDPSDSSRFTIRYELDGVAGTIDGQLLDAETIDLSIRGGPASLPSRSWVVKRGIYDIRD